MKVGELDLSGKRVTVLGLGVEGIDLVRFAMARGAHVTVSDRRPADRLTKAINEISDLPVELSLGSNHTSDIFEADAVFVSQGVPLDLPGLVQAHNDGTTISSMLKLFLELCPGPVVGITGSNGKTTTTALIGEMFRQDGLPHFVGGNIGVGLLEHLPEISPYTWAIIEISHTQLQMADRSPHIACVLNVTPNHLDRFSWERYRELKRNILAHQGPEDYAILSHDDAETRAMAETVIGQRLSFSLSSEIPDDGIYVREGWAIWRRHHTDEPLFPINSLALRGVHNQANAIAAAACAATCGVSQPAIARAVSSFKGVPHRLEKVATARNVDFYDDSIGTTPDRTLAGLQSFNRPIVLLLGGREKNLPMEDLAKEAGSRCRAIIFFGEAGGKFEKVVTNTMRRLPPANRPQTMRMSNLAEAVEAASKLAKDGDAVLLSPAASSFDAYNNFQERGQHFRSLVQDIVDKEAEPSLQ